MARLTWDEMVQRYPDQWIAVKNAEMNGADIISGEVVAALPDTEMRKFRMSNSNSGYIFRRTSDGNFPTIITSTNFGIRIGQGNL